jgi:hypothetical protein
MNKLVNIIKKMDIPSTPKRKPIDQDGSTNKLYEN